ncbi:MAG: hypothetical protein PUD10_09945 [Lachnospira sp.]|nr:hypothetical protein [Lachnospira sp.]
MKKINLRLGLRKKKLNDKGSTMIIVLIMASFVMILATVVTSTAMVNLKMKYADKESTKTFYTSEDAVDEIYAALGKTSMESFNKAYEEEMSHITSGTISINGKEVTYTQDNSTSNKYLRMNYTFQLLKALDVADTSGASEDTIKYDETGKYFNTTYIATQAECNAFVNVVNSYIEDTHVDSDGNPTLKVNSISGLKIEKTVNPVAGGGTGLPVYTLRFTDCVVQFITEAGYYSYITFDGQLGMPDFLVDFADSDSSGLSYFADYALIGNTGINIQETTGNKGVTLNGSAYGGKKNGIKISKGAKLTFGGNNNLLVTGGDIDVNGGTFKVNGTNSLWCYTLKTSGNEGTSNIEMSNTTSSYVKDDLQIDGDNSTVTLGGQYYGYGYEGRALNADANHYYSSAIIVNGKNSKINMSALNTLVVAGRAYIDYNSLAKPYATGESLSFIGNEEMYLVPTSLIEGGSNPVIKDVNSVVTPKITADNFFGYKYLNTKAPNLPYTTREIKLANGSTAVYYYLNFEDSEAQTAYVKAAVDDTAFNTLLTETGAASDTKKLNAYKTTRDYVKNVISLNAYNIGSIITGNMSANVNANSSLVMVRLAGDNSTEDVQESSGTYTNAEFTRDFDDLASRFTVLTKILKKLDFNKDGSRVYYNSNTINDEVANLSSYTENDVYNNFISATAFKNYTSTHSNPVTVNGYTLLAWDNSNTGSPALEISNDNAAFSGNSGRGGIVVASGDVVVKKDFAGVIMAGGTITVEDGVTVTNTLSGTTPLALLQSNEAEEFRKIFTMYDSGNGTASGTGKNVENLTYSDLVSFINWRKSEDANN